MTDALLVHFNLLPRMALVAAYVQIRDRERESLCMCECGAGGLRVRVCARECMRLCECERRIQTYTHMHSHAPTLLILCSGVTITMASANTCAFGTLIHAPKCASHVATPVLRTAPCEEEHFFCCFSLVAEWSSALLLCMHSHHRPDRAASSGLGMEYVRAA